MYPLLRGRSATVVLEGPPLGPVVDAFWGHPSGELHSRCPVVCPLTFVSKTSPLTAEGESVGIWWVRLLWGRQVAYSGLLFLA